MQTTRMMSSNGLVTRSIVSMLLTTSVLAFNAGAEPIYPFATLDTSKGTDNGFELDFIDFGFVTEAGIDDTEFVLRVEFTQDGVRFVDYCQNIAPLFLPGPDGTGISTGDILVEIDGSVAQTFDLETGEFVTTDLYAISFDGDLSAFGIESPFILESTSRGTINFDPTPAGGDPTTTGTVELVWGGESELQNPTDPKVPLRFSYACKVVTEFVVTGIGDTDGDIDVDLADFALLQRCFTGSDVAFLGDVCELVDLDRDNDVDSADFDEFQNRVTGAQ